MNNQIIKKYQPIMDILTKPSIYSLVAFFLISIVFVGCSQTEQRILTYTNPIIDTDMADPCVFFDNGFYYLFATGGSKIDGKAIRMYKSADLNEWTAIGGAVQRGDTSAWNFGNFWAPEVIKLNGKFYLYYTACTRYSPMNSGNRVGAAVADNIEGPYTDLGVVVPHASIDGHPFVDDDGQMYMYYTIEYGNSDSLQPGLIYVDKMISPTVVEGKPRLVLDNYSWQEGPVVQHVGDEYILTFSEGNYRNDTYNVRYAKSLSPYGPFKEGNHQILKSNDVVKGPGHHFLFKDEGGKDWIAYHGWDTAYTARYSRIDPIVITSDTIYCNGPTYTPQEVIITIKK